MKKVLICWVGHADLRAATHGEDVGLGPIAQAVQVGSYDQIDLISDYPAKKTGPFLKWLQEQTGAKPSIRYESLTTPTHFGEIYEAAVRTVTATQERHKGEASLTFHLSPGTPAMAAVWIILAKTRFPAELIESSRDHGVKVASVPFDISADFLPDLLRRPDEQLERHSGERPPEAPEFADIIHRSRGMEKLINRARKVALRSFPALIEGESGTGKELLARAMHRASARRDAPFVAVNCGAISAELVESELFGHEKGAFTGANRSHHGYFEAANSGTLFLDEVGELPLSTQVKLLRALQEGEVVRVGATAPVQIDVRILAATNRTLTTEIADGRFREDLFYRLAVAVLKLPPLRDRQGDLSLLIEHLLQQVNKESEEEPGYQHKKISPSARNLMLSHPWPGNIRELLNTLRRAAIWSEGKNIGVEDMREALLPIRSNNAADILHRPLGDGLNLPQLLTAVGSHYLTRALDEAHGNKTRAAELVGLPSYQTFSNWLTKYGVNR